MNTGIDKNSREAIANKLTVLLADSYLLYMKTHGYHWNVSGPMFLDLHNLFMSQYEELWISLDQIAERIKALGGYAPHSYMKFRELSSIEELDQSRDALDMVVDLLKGQEVLISSARDVLPEADIAGDETTVDLITQRLAVHEKNAWMLRSILDLH